MTDTTKNQTIVPLQLVIDAIEMANDEWHQYMDMDKMEIVFLPDYPFAGKYDKDEQELADLIEAGWNTRFFMLPSHFDIHEYNIMEQFIRSLPEGPVQNSLAYAIRGRGAFRRFKDGILQYGIEQEWYDYRQAKYRKIAIEWCENHGLRYRAGD